MYIQLRAKDKYTQVTWVWVCVLGRVVVCVWIIGDVSTCWQPCQRIAKKEEKCRQRG